MKPESKYHCGSIASLSNCLPPDFPLHEEKKKEKESFPRVITIRFLFYLADVIRTDEAKIQLGKCTQARLETNPLEENNSNVLLRVHSWELGLLLWIMVSRTHE